MFDNAAKSLWSHNNVRRNLLEMKPVKRPASPTDFEEEEGGAIPSMNTHQAMDAFFAAQEMGDKAELTHTFNEVIRSWRADNASGGVPVHGHLPLPSRFAETVAMEIEKSPSPMRSRELTDLLASSELGVRVAVGQQMRELLQPAHSYSSNKERRPEETGEPQVPSLFAPRGVSELRGRHTTIEVADDFEPQRRSDSQNQNYSSAESEFETLEYDPERDRLDPTQVYDPNPYNYLSTLSPEEYQQFLQGAARTAETTANFLRRALYELSPLSDADDFFQAVRSGDYALAAVVVLMAMPPLKGVRVGHHIVAKAASRHKELRDLFRDYGINIDDPHNVARMIDDAHRVIHTTSWYNYVSKRVLNARSVPEVRAVLRDIRRLVQRFNDRRDSRKHFPPKRPPKR